MNSFKFKFEARIYLNFCLKLELTQIQMIFSNQERQNLLIEFPSNLFSFQLCTVCNLWVTTTMSLKRHKKHKHPELYVIEEKLRSELDERKRYKCDICDKKIASYSSLSYFVLLKLK